jgi:hypothetical protein
MKKSLFLFLLIFVFNTVSYAQSGKYLKKNLKNTSTEELELLMGKAKNLRKAGWITTGSGALLFVTGLLMEDGGWMVSEPSTKSQVGTAMALVGLPAILVGTTLLITGSTRVKKINKVFNGKVSFHITPYNHKIPTINSHQYGLALNVNF